MDLTLREEYWIKLTSPLEAGYLKYPIYRQYPAKYEFKYSHKSHNIWIFDVPNLE
jgi:hypothetical protein